jgi:hypothetical protein
VNGIVEIFDEYGRKTDIKINTIDSIYFSEVDKLIFIDDCLVFVSKKTEYFVSSRYEGYCTILNDLQNSGLNIQRSIDDFPANLPLGVVFTVFDRQLS